MGLDYAYKGVEGKRGRVPDKTSSNNWRDNLTSKNLRTMVVVVHFLPRTLRGSKGRGLEVRRVAILQAQERHFHGPSPKQEYHPNFAHFSAIEVS